MFRGVSGIFSAGFSWGFGFLTRVSGLGFVARISDSRGRNRRHHKNFVAIMMLLTTSFYLDYQEHQR